MSSGTKVTLGALVVLAIVMVGYYAIVVKNEPGPNPGEVAAAPTADPHETPSPAPTPAPAPIDPVASVIPDPEPAVVEEAPPPPELDFGDTRLSAGDQMITDTPLEAIGDDPPATQPAEVVIDTPAEVALDTPDVPVDAPGETPVIAIEPDTIVMGQVPEDGHAPETYIVQEGDSLWKIAKKTLGSGAKSDLIAKANPNVNPDRIKPGMKLVIPRPVAERGPVSEKTPTDPLGLGFDDETKIVIVGENEGLWDIAAREYGDGTKWRLIYTANKDVIKDPNVIRSGMKLKVPPLPRD